MAPVPWTLYVRVRQRLEFSIGFDVTEPVRLAILKLSEAAWVDSIQQDVEPRDGAEDGSSQAKAVYQERPGEAGNGHQSFQGR